MKHAILFAILSALSAWGNAQTSGVKGEEVICVDRTGEVKDIAEAGAVAESRRTTFGGGGGFVRRLDRAGGGSHR